MDFRVNEDQAALQEGIRSFCEGRVSIEQLRELEGKGFESELWSELAEMGVFGLRLPEADGGVGLGTADAVLVFEELGKALVPGPLAWTHLAAGLVDGAADGTAVVGGLDLSDGHGAPYIIEHFENLDVLLLLYADRIERVAPKALDAKPVATPLDPLTPIFEVSEIPEGEVIGGAEDAQRMRFEGAVLVSGQLLGITETTLAMSLEYTKGREQFNRPIGGFQALKHIMADCFVRQEATRAVVYAAGATIDDPLAGDVSRAVSSAKAMAGESAWKNSRAAVQLHGGMGFTWEVPVHYYLKRTRVLENVFGTSEEHADALAEGLGQAVA
ncbi:MAG: acyl-CoA/acyl-ACP dehydrogenase [Deltaproteobacteria bacterium]|nr:acyl-CoA/acyl-ACP dehydrogenase [Deltaproteobacteria bacterium]MBW2359443.1 acyl-CoA/acyl-ACP dehydrogenase [Deltaproteobacteria bacterium]